jgi:hypothetical protein
MLKVMVPLHLVITLMLKERVQKHLVLTLMLKEIEQKHLVITHMQVVTILLQTDVHKQLLGNIMRKIIMLYL